MATIQALLANGQSSFANALFTGFAQTSLSPTEMLVYLFLTQWQQTHKTAPDLPSLAQAVKLPVRELYTTLNNLVSKKAIRLVTRTTPNGQSEDVYDVTPLLDQLLSPVVQTEISNTEDAGARLFSKIEIEFGRPLSPIEQQTIHDWLNQDQYAPDVIYLALKEAVLNQAYSLRYMDRILLGWERRHLTTAAQIQADQAKQEGR